MKRESDDLSSKLSTLREEIQKREDAKRYPELKKKYEGKFFKYNNGYSNGNRWWLYSFCRRVNSPDNFDTFSFETCSLGKITIEFSGNEFIFQKQISRTEYMNAYQKLLKAIKVGGF